MLIYQTENIKWMGIALRYLEHQIKPVENWGKLETEVVFTDAAFEKEFDFICKES